MNKSSLLTDIPIISKIRSRIRIILISALALLSGCGDESSPLSVAGQVGEKIETEFKNLIASVKKIGSGAHPSSSVEVSFENVTVTDLEPAAKTPTEVPKLFGDKREVFQSQSILHLTVDKDLLAGKSITRVYNVTTNADLVADLSSFSSAGTQDLPLGEGDNIAKFKFGPNQLRLELRTADQGENSSFSVRNIKIFDFSVGGTSLNAQGIAKRSAGHVDLLSGAVQVGDHGGVLTTGLVPIVFQ